jgi:hypothetical protein
MAASPRSSGDRGMAGDVRKGRSGLPPGLRGCPIGGRTLAGVSMDRLASGVPGAVADALGTAAPSALAAVAAAVAPAGPFAGSTSAEAGAVLARRRRERPRSLHGESRCGRPARAGTGLGAGAPCCCDSCCGCCCGGCCWSSGRLDLRLQEPPHALGLATGRAAAVAGAAAVALFRSTSALSVEDSGTLLRCLPPPLSWSSCKGADSFVKGKGRG